MSRSRGEGRGLHESKVSQSHCEKKMSQSHCESTVRFVPGASRLPYYSAHIPKVGVSGVVVLPTHKPTHNPTVGSRKRTGEFTQRMTLTFLRKWARTQCVVQYYTRWGRFRKHHHEQDSTLTGRFASTLKTILRYQNQAGCIALISEGAVRELGGGASL